MTEFSLMALAADGKLPEWIRILPLGKVELSDGREPFRVDLTAVDGIIQGFMGGGVDLVIDYEHQSLVGERAPAAGWIKELQGRPDGLWGRVEWTQQAGEYLKNKEYRYFSPVLRLDPKTRRPMKLMHLGLTNTPAIRHLDPLVAKAVDQRVEEALKDGKIGQAMRGWATEYCGRDPEGFQAFVTQAPKLTNQPKTGQRQEAAKAMIEKMKQLLGLSGEQGEGDVLALAEQRFKLADAAASLPEIAQAAGLEATATPSQIKGAVLALKSGAEQLTGLRTDLEALKAEQRQGQAQKAVDEARTARKITPAQETWALKYATEDLEGFKAFVAAAPEILAEGGLKIPAGGRTAGGVLDEDGLAVCKQLGIKPEDHLATKQQMAQSK